MSGRMTSFYVISKITSRHQSEHLVTFQPLPAGLRDSAGAAAQWGVAAVAADMEHRLAVTIHACIADYWASWRGSNAVADQDMPAFELQVLRLSQVVPAIVPMMCCRD